MPDTKCVFRWTEAYSVNVEVLDQQHQELFEVVNELEQALRVGEGMVAIDRILDKFGDLCRGAFRRRGIAAGKAQVPRIANSPNSA